MPPMHENLIPGSNPEHGITVVQSQIVPYHFEVVVCPDCSEKQVAEVVHTLPSFSRVHHCNCGYVIMGNEWDNALAKSPYEEYIEQWGLTPAISDCLFETTFLLDELLHHKNGLVRERKKDLVQRIAGIQEALELIVTVIGSDDVDKQRALNRAKLIVKVKIKDDNHEDSTN